MCWTFLNFLAHYCNCCDLSFLIILGNANNFETMEECILNCSGPDNQGEDESNEEIFISPLDSFSSRLHRLKTSFNNRNRGSLKTESPIQGSILFL